MSPSTTGRIFIIDHTTEGKEARTLIRLALLSELTSRFNGRFASVFVQIHVAHDLAANELVLKVGVDDASRLRRLRALADGPRTHFSGSAGEIPDQLSARADITTVRLGCVCILASLRREKCSLLG
jgi:hypothetical protein